MDKFLKWLGEHWIRPICLVFIVAILCAGCCVGLKMDYDYQIERDRIHMQKSKNFWESNR